jgi:hypothetical protein
MLTLLLVAAPFITFFVTQVVGRRLSDRTKETLPPRHSEQPLRQTYFYPNRDSDSDS